MRCADANTDKNNIASPIFEVIAVPPPSLPPGLWRSINNLAHSLGKQSPERSLYEWSLAGTWPADGTRLHVPSPQCLPIAVKSGQEFGKRYAVNEDLSAESAYTTRPTVDFALGKAEFCGMSSTSGFPVIDTERLVTNKSWTACYHIDTWIDPMDTKQSRKNGLPVVAIEVGRLESA